MAKQEQVIGAAGEQHAENHLRMLGFEMIEKIGTPVRLVQLPGYAAKALNRARYSPKGIFRVIFGEKVSGDRRALVGRSGRSVLIETKTILDRNLRYSDLRSHQPGRLQRHHELGGVSLITWVHSSGIYALQWPIPNFGSRKSITPESARDLQIKDIKELK